MNRKPDQLISHVCAVINGSARQNSWSEATTSKRCRCWASWWRGVRYAASAPRRRDGIQRRRTYEDNARPATQQTQTTVNSDVCDVCSSADPPPAGKHPRRTVVDWIGCEQRPRWFHNVCIRVKSIPDHYVCGNCEWVECYGSHSAEYTDISTYIYFPITKFSPELILLYLHTLIWDLSRTMLP